MFSNVVAEHTMIQNMHFCRCRTWWFNAQHFFRDMFCNNIAYVLQWYRRCIQCFCVIHMLSNDNCMLKAELAGVDVKSRAQRANESLALHIDTWEEIFAQYKTNCKVRVLNFVLSRACGLALCIRVYTYICINMHICIHLHVCVYVHVYLCVYKYMCMYICMYIYIYICIYICT